MNADLLSPLWFLLGAAGFCAACTWFGWAVVLLEEHRGRLRSLVRTRLAAVAGH